MDLQREAQNVIARFHDLQRDAARAQEEFHKLQNMSNMDNRQLRAEAYRQLRDSGTLGSNKDQVLKRLNDGLSVFIPAAEIDHFDEIQFAGSLAASVASGNPGPALAYLEQLAVESKATFLRNLRNAPDQVREKLEREFEALLVRALDRARRDGRPIQLTIEGVTMEAGLATFNNWVDVRYQVPRLVETGEILGVKMYRIEMERHTKRLPMPNTFLPYVRLQVNYAAN